MLDNFDETVYVPILPDSFCKVERFGKYISCGYTKEFPKGSTIVFPGEQPKALLYVISGTLRVDSIDSAGREKLMFIIGKHAVAVTVFMENKHEIQITTLEKSTICCFTKNNLLDIFQKDPEIIFDILKNQISKIAFLMNENLNLSFYRPAQRIMRLIYNMCIEQGSHNNGVWKIETNISQKTIGEITGTHHVTVNRLLSMLKKEKILVKSKYKITVYDLSRLETIMTEDIKY